MNRTHLIRTATDLWTCVLELRAADEHNGGSPEACLLELIGSIETEEGVPTSAACDYIFQRLGLYYEGKRFGGFGVCVTETDRGQHVSWMFNPSANDPHTFTALNDLLESIASHGAAPTWYEDDWVRVLVDCEWVEKGLLEATPRPARNRN